MNGLFVPYKESLILKDLGFNEVCFGFYNNAIADVYIKQDFNDELREIYKGDFEAPLYQQTFRWFREKYRLSGEPQSHQFYFSYNIIYDTFGENICKAVSYGFESYENAELECLKKLIEIVKNK